jgi:hypothetical protein
MNRKINILVLSVYLCYSLFPLLYSLDVASPEYQRGIRSSVHDDGTEPHIALLQSADESAAAPGSCVLLKKKRAISISFKILPHTAATVSGLASAFETCDKAYRVLDDRSDCPNGFRFYHSGVSPPSA